jgi:hypothetical protein
MKLYNPYLIIEELVLALYVSVLRKPPTSQVKGEQGCLLKSWESNQQTEFRGEPGIF